MIRKSEKIKLVVGFIIVISIFVFIGISSYFEKLNSSNDLLNFETKYSDMVPENFSKEVFDVSNIAVGKIRSDKSGNVVGFSLSSGVFESFNLVKNQLLNNGWNFVESGSSSSASFYKSEGQYTWLFVNCISVGGETSIVLTSN